MKKYIFLAAGLFLLFSCAAKKKTVVVSNVTGGDGSSFEKAVIINELHEKEGIEAENTWLRHITLIVPTMVRRSKIMGKNLTIF